MFLVGTQSRFFEFFLLLNKLFICFIARFASPLNPSRYTHFGFR